MRAGHRALAALAWVLLWSLAALAALVSTAGLRAALGQRFRLSSGAPLRIHTFGQLGAVLRTLGTAAWLLAGDAWALPLVRLAGACLVLGLLFLLLALRPPSDRTRERWERERRAKEKADEKARAQAPIVAEEGDLRREGWLSGGEGGWPLGRDTVSGRRVFLPRARQTEHVLVLGGTGAGKSSRFYLPWLYEEASLPPSTRASLIVFDPKAGGELTDLSIGYLHHRGYAVFVYDPTSAGSVRCNVLAEARTAAGVRSVMTQWIDCQVPASPGGAAGHYKRLRIALLTGAALALRAQAQAAGRDGQRTVSLADVAAYYRPPRSVEDVLADLTPLAASGDPELADTLGLVTDLATKPAHLADVLTELRDLMAATRDPQVAAALRGHDLDAAFWHRFITTPSVLYVPVAMEGADALKPVLVTFLALCIRMLDREAGGGTAPLSRPVRIVLDEFANLGKIAGFSRIVSTARYRNIGLAVAIQSQPSIKALYGAEADVILDNLLVHLLLAKSRPDALKRYTVAGLHIDLPLLMERDTALVQRAGDVPLRVRTRGWFRSRRLRRRVERDRAVVTKAVALAHQARVLGLTPQGGEREELPLPLDVPAAALAPEEPEWDAEDLETDERDAEEELLAGWVRA